MSIARKWFFSALLLIGTSVVSIALAFGNYYYFQWISGFFYITDEFLNAMLYSAFLLVIGTTIVASRPRYYGFQIGDSLKHWKQVLVVSATTVAFTVICLLMTPRTPYSGANWAVEMILVPISEEMMWRGVIFSLVFALFGKLHSNKTQFWLTIVCSSMAFGMAHSSNVLVHPVSFVVLQMLFAAIVGTGLGYLRAKTKSVYPPMLVHALFNLVAIML
jgi:membrane protease YdiL (CAAX protease family)